MNVIEAAKAAGFEQVMRHKDGSSTILPTVLFERFADLVLEEAAKVCEEKHANGNWKHDTRHECADSIRALKGAKE